MSLRGVVPYPVTEKQSKLFSAQGSQLTLYNAGPGIVWVSPHNNVSAVQGIPLNPAATIQWDGDNDCYGITKPGEQSTMLATDNSGALNDPSVIADAINSTAITAVGIANAIANSGLTSAGIATAIATQGVPVTLQRLGITSAAGTVDWPPNAWVGGVAQGGGWLVPAGKKLVITSLAVAMLNGNAAVALARLQLVDNPGGGTLFGAFARRVAASAVDGAVVPYGPGSVVFPSQSGPVFREVSAAAGMTYDVTASGVLLP